MSFLDKEVKVIKWFLAVTAMVAAIVFVALWGFCLKAFVAFVATIVIALFVSVVIAGIILVLRGGK